MEYGWNFWLKGFICHMYNPPQTFLEISFISNKCHFNQCMDFVSNYFDANEPLTRLTLFPHFLSGSVLIWTKKEDWSKVHCYQSNFLQNPYFSEYDTFGKNPSDYNTKNIFYFHKKKVILDVTNHSQLVSDANR